MAAKIDFHRYFHGLALAAAMTAAPLCAALAGAPFVSSGRLGPPVHIPRQFAPKVMLDIHGVSQSVGFGWLAPAGQTFNQTFYSPLPSGRYAFQAAPNSGQAFGLYTQAGTWTLNAVSVCSYRGCNYYSGSTLSALFPSLALMVVNPNADITPPSVTAGTILTPTVAIARHSAIGASLTVQDDISGAINANIVFSNGTGKDNINVGGPLTSPVVSSATVSLTIICDCKNRPAGTYDAIAITVSDVAGNVFSVTDPATISSLLGGQTSITLTD
jgi:hypothetical protein